MKDYKKILEAEHNQYSVIEHKWGQNPEGIYNQIVAAWNELKKGDKIFVISRKKFGLKSMVSYLRTQGIELEIVGKGPEDIRMIEIVKSKAARMSVHAPENYIDFSFNNRVYKANVGNAVFSKKGLDEGTQFVLKTFLEKAHNIDSATIADLGAGWGAISLVLSQEYPKAQIIAFENEVSAYEAAKENLKKQKNVGVYNVDVLENDNTTLKEYKSKCDYIVCNFSFHITTEERDAFVRTAYALLKKGGQMFFVTEGKFVSMFEKDAAQYFDIVDEAELKLYKVFVAKKK